MVGTTDRIRWRNNYLIEIVIMIGIFVTVMADTRIVATSKKVDINIIWWYWYGLSNTNTVNDCRYDNSSYRI